MNEIKIEKDKIIQAATKHPEQKGFLETLFPEVFEDQKYFCKIGQLLKRHSYPNSYYAVIKHAGKLKMLCITNSQFWKNEIDCVPEKQYVSVNEIKKLVDYNFKDLYVYEEPTKTQKKRVLFYDSNNGEASLIEIDYPVTFEMLKTLEKAIDAVGRRGSSVKLILEPAGIKYKLIRNDKYFLFDPFEFDFSYKLINGNY